MLDDEARRIINVIMRNSQRMGQLIDDLLAFSRLGRKELSRSNIPMDEMIENVIDEFRRSGACENTAISIHRIPPALGDHTTVRQVWVNLISNALKYSQGNEKPTLEMVLEENDVITYYVKDNGAGFDMAYYDKYSAFSSGFIPQRIRRYGSGIGDGPAYHLQTRRQDSEAKVNASATFILP
jgi:light-regulated signal transduction histidine kinase (bacteriophytochrome)